MAKNMKKTKRDKATLTGMDGYTTTTYVITMPFKSVVKEEEYEKYMEEFGDIVRLKGNKVMLEATVYRDIHADGQFIIFYRYGMADLAVRYVHNYSRVEKLEDAEFAVDVEMAKILYSGEIDWYPVLSDIAERILELCEEDAE